MYSRYKATYTVIDYTVGLRTLIHPVRQITYSVLHVRRGDAFPPPFHFQNLLQRLVNSELLPKMGFLEKLSEPTIHPRWLDPHWKDPERILPPREWLLTLHVSLIHAGKKPLNRPPQLRVELLFQSF